MNVPDLEIVKTLGTALTGIGALAGIAEKINNAQLRQELNGKIADLQGSVISARQQCLEMQDKYEAALKENKQLRAKLDSKASEMFLHDVWWLTSSGLDERHSEIDEQETYKTLWDGPYCPLCKEDNHKWVHLKANGQTGTGGRLVYECGIHNTQYEVPVMRKS